HVVPPSNLIARPPARSTLSPYTTLFRSRLLPQRPAHGGAHEAARGARVHARFHRLGRRRPHPPVHRARRQSAPDSQPVGLAPVRDRKSTRLNSSHVKISYAVFCLNKKTR